MDFTFYQLCWFYFIYSFIGWCGEVCIAAVKKKTFINRGFVSGPFCPIYGAGAVAFAVFLPELTGNPFFLFLGGTILASFIEFATGALLEKLFHQKWWDYSEIRFNFEGYICVEYSFLWGGFALLLTYLINPALSVLINMIPRLAGVIILWILTAFLTLDTMGTSLAIRGMQKRMEQLAQLTEGIGQVSRFLENAITQKIVKRMEKAFPAISPEILKKEAIPKEKPEVFAKGCGFYKLFSLFFIGAFLGDVTETIFCLITTGQLMSRSSVVYGPFSIVWGLGCGLLTAVLYRIRDKSDSYIFVAGTLLGGAYEYICSVFTELVFGTVFWDYSGFRFNLGGRINLLYCFFWGIAAVVWMKLLYPGLSSRIEKLPQKTGKILCNFLMVFMAVNCLISALALARYGERQAEGSKPAENVLEEFLDERFTDERMERIYPNAKAVG
ncbi:MAG: putative ABC transporter permease [Lachnospiraceae bacterium]|nr:putative ABC transporter permease [Lachnospiraceae bacterium]